MKLFLRLLLALFLLNTGLVAAQHNGGHKKERRKIWRKWRKNKQSYNPYLDKKARNKPSAKLAREEKRELKRQKRKYRRDVRRSGKGTKRGPKP